MQLLCNQSINFKSLFVEHEKKKKTITAHYIMPFQYMNFVGGKCNFSKKKKSKVRCVLRYILFLLLCNAVVTNKFFVTVVLMVKVLLIFSGQHSKFNDNFWFNFVEFYDPISIQCSVFSK